MNITHYYWYFSKALTPRFCDEVIAYANQQKEEMARTHEKGKFFRIPPDNRDLNYEKFFNLVSAWAIFLASPSLFASTS